MRLLARRLLAAAATLGLATIGLVAAPATSHAATAPLACNDAKYQNLLAVGAATEKWVGTTPTIVTVSGVSYSSATYTITLTSASSSVITDVRLVYAFNVLASGKDSLPGNPSPWSEADGAFILNPAGADVVNAADPVAGSSTIVVKADGSAADRAAVSTYSGAVPLTYTDANYTSPATVKATDTVPYLAAANTTLLPSTTMSITSQIRQEVATASSAYAVDVQPFYVGIIHCAPTVPAAPTPVAVCGVDNDTVTLPPYDETKLARVDSGWTAGTRTLTYTPVAPYTAMADGTKQTVQTLTDAGTACPTATATASPTATAAAPTTATAAPSPTSAAVVTTAPTLAATGTEGSIPMGALGAFMLLIGGVFVLASRPRRMGRRR